jgi:hypothetical protein
MTPPDDGSHLVFSNDTACHSRVSFYPPHSTSAATFVVGVTLSVSGTDTFQSRGFLVDVAGTGAQTGFPPRYHPGISTVSPEYQVGINLPWSRSSVMKFFSLV